MITERRKLHAIYKPVKAEFCQLAFNGWKGCAHFCLYCYGPRQTHKKPEEFRVPQPKVGDAFMDLKKDLELLSGKETVLAKEGKIWTPVPRPVPHVLLMSDCDPYSPPNGDLSRSRKVLEEFNNYQIPFKVLTKGGTKAVKDFDLYSKDDWFGISLTFMNDADARYWEPKAALPADRIDALRQAHEIGIRTWVSMEAVIDQKQALDLIDLVHGLSDFIWVGKVNRNNEAEENKIMPWSEFRVKAEAKLQALGRRRVIDYQIKNHLNKA